MNQRGTQSVCMGTTRPSTRGHAGASRGFTLVELMITIFVAAILIAVAVPSFQHMIASSKLTATTNDLIGAMRLARMTAIKSNAEVQFCSNDASANNADTTLGAACGAQTGAVYVLSQGAAVQVRAPVDVDNGQQHLHGDVVALTYTPQGLAHQTGTHGPFSNTVATVCTDAFDSENYAVIEMVGGSVAHASTSHGACP